MSLIRSVLYRRFLCTTLSLLQQFSHPVKGRSLLENVVNGTTLVDLEGPWCDIWSLGVVLLRICLGEDTEEDKHDVSEEGASDILNHDSTSSCGHTNGAMVSFLVQRVETLDAKYLGSSLLVWPHEVDP